MRIAMPDEPKEAVVVWPLAGPAVAPGDVNFGSRDEVTAWCDDAIGLRRAKLGMALMSVGRTATNAVAREVEKNMMRILR
jgi:hypothetical protein